MDKNEQLIQLSERGRFWHLDFDDLSPAEQVFRAIWELEGEVNNGGFEQYFFNSAGDTAFAVVDALKAIGAYDMARIAEDANRVFPCSLPPRGREERQALLDSLDREQKAFLESLDHEFYGYPGNLTELLYDYVKRNLADIPGATDIGIY
ncbi:MAG: DMP19 family protein [Sedimentisphaerales bacterium]|nr:DMP19 family protein [Sedimentisphaerales bacterium]